MEKIPLLEFVICLYQDLTISSTRAINGLIPELRELAGKDFSVLNRYDHYSTFLATTTPDTFKKLFGVNPVYSPETGWDFDVSKLEYPSPAIEQVHPNYRLKLA